MSFRVYIGIDDTDSKGSPFGTGHLAKLLVDRLPRGYERWAVTRHQLPQLKGIQFTSHNSPACVVIDSAEPPDLELLSSIAADHVLAHACEGSDPGVCVAADRPELSPLASFGLVASIKVVSQADAHAAASASGAKLLGLGGTSDGVIGAAAAVGLSVKGWFGRLLDYKIPLKQLPNPVQVGALRESGILVVSIDRQAFIPMDDDWVETFGWVRPYIWANQAVLPVIPKGNPARLGGRWRTVHYRSPLKRYLKPILKPKIRALKRYFGLVPEHRIINH